MPVLVVPETLKKAWGAEAVEIFVPWLEELLEEKVLPRDEYRGDISALKGDISALKGDVSALKEDMRELRLDMRELRREMNERFEEMNRRFEEMDRRFDGMYDRMLVQSRWLVGSIALFGTVISILLAIGQFVR